MTKQYAKQIAKEFFGSTTYKIWQSYSGKWTFCACIRQESYGHMFTIDNGEMIIKG